MEDYVKIEKTLFCKSCGTVFIKMPEGKYVYMAKGMRIECAVCGEPINYDPGSREVFKRMDIFSNIKNLEEKIEKTEEENRRLNLKLSDGSRYYTGYINGKKVGEDFIKINGKWEVIK